MSAPVTEAHRAITENVCELLDSVEMVGPSPAEHAAQLIADSEAKACAQLRAEVERLKKQIKDDNRSYGCELRDPYGTIWEQATKDYDRAGKAERALAELREWQAGVIANERLHHAERKDAIARAERAEVDLAAERARLRQLALDSCRAAAIVPLVWYPEGYYVNPNDLGKINKQQVDACVAAIEAAMKEETK